MAGWLVRAASADAPTPILVQINGLDSTKEMLYRVGLPQWLAERGISSLVIDQPGTGEALRLQGLHAVYNSEVWASKVVDWLETRSDIDSNASACKASLSAATTARAPLHSSRGSLAASPGERITIGATCSRSDLRAKALCPSRITGSTYAGFGVRKDMDEFMRIAEKVHLDGVVERIKVPFLVTHGEQDKQIPVAWAYRTYEQLINSPKRELKIFTQREGGVQHSSFDNSINAGHYIADWVAETLGGRRPEADYEESSMRIIGPDALVFGVDDVSACTQYLTDYGLTPVGVDAHGGKFEALDGTAIIVRRKDDPTLPKGIRDGDDAARDRVWRCGRAALERDRGGARKRSRRAARIGRCGASGR